MFPGFDGTDGLTSAQVLKGNITDEIDKTPVAAATVTVTNIKDSARVRTAVSDTKGTFMIQDVPPGNYSLSISSVGYMLFTKQVTITDTLTDIGNTTIQKSAKVLHTVTVNTTAPPVKQKADTLEYASSAFKVNPDANAEDLIKKMPGITVDKGGTVTAHGETVKKVTIDGREFFGDDATAALRNMPSEVIDRDPGV